MCEARTAISEYSAAAKKPLTPNNVITPSRRSPVMIQFYQSRTGFEALKASTGNTRLEYCSIAGGRAHRRVQARSAGRFQPIVPILRRALECFPDAWERRREFENWGKS